MKNLDVLFLWARGWIFFFKSTLPLSLATCCDSSFAYLFGFWFPLYFLLLEKSSAFL